MSWDVGLFKFKRRYASIDQIPEDESTLLGSAADVRARIDAMFPGVDWADPTWGTWDADCGSIEFNMGQADVIQSIALHVRASNVVVAPIVQLCLDNGWQAIDYSSGAFLEQSESPEAGLSAWRDYRNRILRGAP